MILTIITFAGFAVAIMFANSKIKLGGYIASGVFVIGFVLMSFFIIDMPAQFNAYTHLRESVQKRLTNAENNADLTKGTRP